MVSRDDDALDRRGIMQRLQRDDHLRGRAIWVRDDVLLEIIADRLGIHFGYDQGNVRVHPIKRRVINHCAARSRKAWRMNLRCFAANSKQRHVPPSRVKIVDILDLELPPSVTEFDFIALAARRRERGNVIKWKCALGKDIEHFTPDIAGRARDHDPITHFEHSCCAAA